MTEEQKDTLIAKMIDASSSLSDEELDAILHDDELKDIYEMSSAVSGACISQPELDMEMEWKRFRLRIKPKPSYIRWVMRVAAIFLGAVFISGIMYKMIDIIFIPYDNPVIAKVGVSKGSATVIPAVEEIQEPRMQPKSVAVSSAEKRDESTPKRYIAKTKMDKSTKAMSTDDIDIDCYLRVQQARIDNDLAMQSAVVYEEEFSDIMILLDAIGAHNDEMNNTIRKITMQ